MIDTRLVPLEITQSLYRYAEHHIPTGSFLRAVLENDLVETVARADSTNIHILPEIVQYCYENLSHNCWGSRKIVKEFLKTDSAKGGGTVQGFTPDK